MPSAGNLCEDMLPCSRQGLPPWIVTYPNCELLPHSFHLNPVKNEDVSSLWHFP